MQLKSTLESYAGRPSTDLVLERLPSGQCAWLCPDADDEPRYVVTDLGRRAIAEYAVFGPARTVADG